MERFDCNSLKTSVYNERNFREKDFVTLSKYPLLLISYDLKQSLNLASKLSLFKIPTSRTKSRKSTRLDLVKSNKVKISLMKFSFLKKLLFLLKDKIIKNKLHYN